MSTKEKKEKRKYFKNGEHDPQDPSEYYDSSDDEDLNLPDDIITKHMQYSMMNQFNRRNENSEENVAIRKRRKEFEADEKNCQQFYKKSFILEIYIKQIRPRIIRKIRVPGGIDLRVLHDRVIAPSFGWCRAYHAYYFRQNNGKKQFSPVGFPIKGICFGDTESGSIDSSHALTHGIWLVDDTNIKLAQILNQVGQKLDYLYDFGDSWFHKVKLVEIDDYFHNGIVELLDGARACPPEDHGSIREYTKTLDILKDPKNKKWNEANAGCLHAANYQMHHEKGKKIFNPDEFDLKLTRKKLALALQSKTSENKGQNLTMTSIGRMGSFFSPNEMHKPKFEETTQLDPDNLKKICAVCGKSTTTRCSRCRVVFYCTVDHQKEDWPQHKKNCLKPNK